MSKETNIRANSIVSKYTDLLDLDVVNKTIDLTNNKDLGKVSKQTLKNISKWALNGASNKEIADNLELTEKQFKTLCALCPTLVYIMQDSRELAEIVLAGSLFQRAIGGQRVMHQQAVKLNDFDEMGNKIGEHVEVVDLYDELPPDSNLLKFLAEHKLSEKFGKASVDEDKELKNVVGSMDLTQLEQLEQTIRKETNESERNSK